MKRSEFQYLELGRALERAHGEYEWHLQRAAKMVSEEPTEEDRAQAQQLVERGRQEARTGR
jgi:hypothetical protein